MILINFNFLNGHIFFFALISFTEIMNELGLLVFRILNNILKNLNYYFLIRTMIHYKADFVVFSFIMIKFNNSLNFFNFFYFLYFFM